MKRFLLTFALATLALKGQFAAAEELYFGGPVISLDGGDRVFEALLVRDGRIAAVGTRRALEAVAADDAARIDLAGRALLPGFVDSHSHATGIGLQAMAANLLPAPDGEGNSIADLQRIMREYLAGEPELLAGIGWLIGFGYDDSQLADGRYPDRHDLDAISTDIPIVIVHQSGHLGVANSAALARAGVTATTPDPPGGVFRREESDGQPSGIMEENAFYQVLLNAVSVMDDVLSDEMTVAGAELMARYGFTTAQDGRSSPANLASMARVAAAGLLPIDVVAYPDTLMMESVESTRAYDGGYRVGGVKLAIDGSPQGKTAWLTQPYYVPPEGQEDDYAGYPAADEATTNAAILKAFANDQQILVHANGDAAIDAMITAVRLAREAYPEVEGRPVLIHGQTLRFDQVAQLDELGIFPSLFPMHTFYWGDWHRESVLGPERAENISPTGWLGERDMMFGTHHDAPVALPDSMRVLSATVTRVTRSGRVLGPEHRVDVMTALRAMTLWPAWQHFEESSKGSLEVGKLADLVVLSENPLTVEPEELAGLQVLATLKDGVVVYRSEDSGLPALP
jgi:predicted amidohydrolase YtcJ